MLDKRKIKALSTASLFIGLAILYVTNYWWPGILLVLWVALGVREYLSKRYYDFFISTIILLGLFAVTTLNLDWNVLVPVLFVMGAVYIILREFFFSTRTRLEEKIRQLEAEIDEEKEQGKRK